jgi:hypothetical protein
MKDNMYVLVRVKKDDSNWPVLTTMPTGNRWASKVCHSGGAVLSSHLLRGYITA